MGFLLDLARRAGKTNTDKCWECGSLNLDVSMYGSNGYPTGYDVTCKDCHAYYVDHVKGIKYERGNK